MAETGQPQQQANAGIPNQSNIAQQLKGMGELSKNLIKPLQSVLDSMNNIAKSFNKKALFNSVKFGMVKKHIILYFNNLTELLVGIAAGFEELNKSKELNAVMELIGGKDAWEETLEDTKTHDKITTKHGKKKGFFEILKEFFEIPQLISNIRINPVTMVIMRMRIKRIFKIYTGILNNITELFSSVDGAKVNEDVENKMAIITGTMSTIYEIFDTLSRIYSPISVFKIRKLFKFLLGDEKKQGLFGLNKSDETNGLIMILFDSISRIITKHDKVEEDTKKLLNGVKQLTQAMLFLSVFGIIVVISNKVIILAIDKTVTIIEKLNDLFGNIKFDKDKVENAIEVFNNIKDFTKSVIKAMLNIMLLAPVALLTAASLTITIIAMTVIWLEVKLLSAAILGIAKILVNLCRKKEINEANINVKRIMAFIGTVIELFVVLWLMGLLITQGAVLSTILLGMLAFAGVLGIMLLTMWVISKMDKLLNESMKNLYKIFIFVGAVMMLFGIIWLLGYIVMQPGVLEMVLMGLVAFVGVVIALIALSFAIKIAGEQVQQSFKQLLSLVIFMAVCLAFTYIVTEIARKMEEVGWEALGKVGTVLLAVVGAFAGIALLLGTPPISEVMGIGIPLLAILSGAILGFSASLWVIVDAIEKLVNLGDIPDDTFSKVIKPLANMILTVVKNVKAFNPVSIGIAMAGIGLVLPLVLMIGGIAVILSKIANLTIPDEGAVWDPEKHCFDKYRTMNQTDFQRATDNAGLMLTTVLDIFNGLDLSTIENTSAWTLKKLGFALDIIGHLGSLINVIEKISNLVMPAPNAVFDSKTGKFSKYVQMSEDEFDRCQFQACQLLGTVLDIFKDMDLSAIEDTSKRTLKKLGMAMDIFGAMGPMIDRIQVLATGKVTSFDDQGKPIGDPIDFTTPETKRKIRASVMSLFTSFIDPFVTKDSTLGMTLAEYIAEFVKEADDTFEDLTPIIKSMGEIKKLLQPYIDGKWDNLQVSQNIETIICSPLTHLNVNYNTAVMENNIRLLKSISSVLEDMYKKLRPVFDANKKPKDIDAMFKALLYRPIKTIQVRFNYPVINTNIKKLSQLATIAERLGNTKGSSDKIERMSQAGIDFLKQVNVMKLDNLKSAVALFYQLRKITENVRGNFDKLADTLKVDLIENLEKISELLDDIVTKQTLPSMGGNSVQSASQRPATGDLATVIDSKPKPATEKEKQEQRKKEKEKRSQDEIVRQLVDIGEQMREIIKKIS